MKDPRTTRNAWVWAVLVLSASGCAVNLPSDYPLASYTRKQLSETEPDEPLVIDSTHQDDIKQVLFEEFGSPDQPEMRPEFMSDEEYESTWRGSQLFRIHCMHCHGLAGGGDGPTAPFLKPRPRDYRRGVFKWKSTLRNARPTRADLMNLVRHGAIGTSMPPFILMPDQDLDDLVNYVIFLAKRGEVERSLLIHYNREGEVPSPSIVADFIRTVHEDWQNAGTQVVAPEEPMPEYAAGSSEYEESVGRGRGHFLGEAYGCYKCHGRDGTADPEDIVESEKKKLVDAWGQQNLPRNLTLGLFRGGLRPLDLYRRIHQGIAGTGMPEQYKPGLPRDKEFWDLVNFVRTLHYRPDLLAPPPTAAHAHAGAQVH